MTDRARPHWRGLDGLRALAVIAVVIYHFSPDTLPGGFLGVDVFFVISGYLITRLLTEEFLATGRIDVKRFYRRRARRLLPALGLILVAVTVGSLFWRDQLATVRGGVLSTAVFGGNWWLAFDHQSYFVALGRPSMLQHLWSLGIEEQFYLLWPVAVAALLAAGRRAVTTRGWTVRRGVARLCAVAVALAVASTVLTWILADVQNVPYGNDGSTLYFGTHTHCMGLLLGASLGAWSAVRAPRVLNETANRCLDAAAATALVVLIVLAAQLTDLSHSLYRGDFLLISALVVVVTAIATRPDSVVGRALDAPLLRWIGVRSYSIYLWHWPITVITRPGIDTSMPVWLDQLFRIALTIAMSDLSYRFVETPVRRFGPRQVWLAVVRRVRSGWRTVPPSLEVLAPIALAGSALIAVIVIIVGPAAPRPAAALGASPGGRNLPLNEPTVAPTSGTAQHHRGLPKLSGFGDSVLLGARRALGEVFPGGKVDAVSGRQPDPILADVRAEASADRLHPLVVLHLGNNGLISPDDLRNTLQSLVSRRLVIVLNDHPDPHDRDWQRPNDVLMSKTVPHFDNAVLIDWDRIAGQHPAWLYKDGLHLTPTGATAYAHLLASTYRTAVGLAK